MGAPFKAGDLVVFRWNNDGQNVMRQRALGGPGPYEVASCARWPDGGGRLTLTIRPLSSYDAGHFMLAPREEG